MPAPLDRGHRDLFDARIDALLPDAHRRWGRMQPVEVLAHLRAALRLSLGRITLPDQSTPLFRNRFTQWILFGALPWPRGKIEAPSHFQPTPADSMEEERVKLGKAMDQFVEALEREPQTTAVHPAFGSLTLRKWAKLHGKHFDHHLKQFGA